MHQACSSLEASVSGMLQTQTPRHVHTACPVCARLGCVPWWHHGTATPHIRATWGILPRVRAEHPCPCGSSCRLGDSTVASGTGPARGHVPRQLGAHRAGAAGGDPLHVPEPDSCLISQARAGGGWKLSRGRWGRGWDGRTLPAPHRRAAWPPRHCHCRAGGPWAGPCCPPRTARRGLRRRCPPAVLPVIPPAIPPSSSGSS